ncbi:MAG: hypothetical protein R3B82_18020 [Sandaracinaceae bacterium]
MARLDLSRRALALLFGVTVSLGCDGSTACVPGESVACTGPGGCAGFQICNAEGTGFGACQCGSPDAGLDASTPPDAGPDASSPDASAPDAGPPVCGDGRLDGDEACDDGNDDACDGCDACAVRRSLRFDGDRPRLQIDDGAFAALAEAFTVELRVRLGPGPGEPEAIEVSTRDGSDGWQLRAEADAVALRVGAGAARLPADLLDGEWHHLAWAHQEQAGVAMVDDVFLDGRMLGLGPRALVHGGGSLVVGAFVDDAGAVSERSGTIDELRVSEGIRYQVAFRPERRHAPDARTIGLYHFDEDGGTVADDASAYEHDGTYVRDVRFVADERYGVCVPPAPLGPVQDVSASPVPVRIGGRDFEVHGLSTIGWSVDVIETPIIDGRTHKEPGLPDYPDVTMTGVRGASADVAWLSEWVATPSAQTARVVLDEPGGARLSFDLVDVTPARGSTAPTDLGGGRAELAEIVLTVGGITGFAGDASGASFVVCGSPEAYIEIEAVGFGSYDPSTVVEAPAPRTSDPLRLEGVRPCGLDDLAYRADHIVWGEEAREHGARYRHSLSVVSRAYVSGSGWDEMARLNVYEAWPAEVWLFDAERPYGSSYDLSLVIVTDRAERQPP